MISFRKCDILVVAALMTAVQRISHAALIEGRISWRPGAGNPPKPAVTDRWLFYISSREIGSLWPGNRQNGTAAPISPRGRCIAAPAIPQNPFSAATGTTASFRGSSIQGWHAHGGARFEERRSIRQANPIGSCALIKAG
jgi:hypothetical protein